MRQEEQQIQRSSLKAGGRVTDEARGGAVIDLSLHKTVSGHRRRTAVYTHAWAHVLVFVYGCVNLCVCVRQC